MAGAIGIIGGVGYVARKGTAVVPGAYGRSALGRDGLGPLNFPSSWTEEES